MEDRSLKHLGRLGRTSRCGKSERTKVYCFFPEPLTGLTNGGNDYGYSQWHYQEDDRFCWPAASAHEVGTSLSPNEYIRNRRLKFARELLLDGKHNVTETAYLAGFGTPNDFRDCFRAEYGLSPTDFVNQNRN